MARMPLNNSPIESNGQGGHVVSTAQPEVKTIVMSTTPDENIVNVSKNIVIIDKVAGSLSDIVNVSNNMNNITGILTIKAELAKVANKTATITELASIADELDILAQNIDPLKKAVQDIDTVKLVGDHIDELHFLWDIRAHIVQLNTAKDRVLSVLDNMTNIDKVAGKLPEIELVALHMLCVEIVAHNIDLLHFFRDNINVFNTIIDMRTTLDKLAGSLELLKKFIDVVDRLPEIVGKFEADINLIKENAYTDFKERADAILKEMQAEYDKFKREYLDIRERILTVEDKLLKLSTDFNEFKQNVLDIIAEKLHCCHCCPGDGNGGTGGGDTGNTGTPPKAETDFVIV